MMVAAYLINPLVGEYPYDAVAKDYLGLMISSKKDYLGKLDFTQMMKEDEKRQWTVPATRCILPGNQSRFFCRS